ncbi:MAG: ABC transporter permease [Treponema sp.]|nr:ABC transporter permease [Treponema sp.]
MNFYIRKIVSFLVTLIVISILTFVVFQVLPGDPALTILGVDADDVQLLALQKTSDIKANPFASFITWIVGVFHGDMGVSYRYQVPVLSIVSPCAVVTLQLALFVIIITVVLGLPLGILLALFDDAPFSSLFSSFIQIGISLPSFCVSIVFIVIFSVILQLFPSMGYVPWHQDPGLCLRSLFLPAVSLAFGTTGTVIRYVRSSFVRQFHKDYIRTAKGKGVPFYSIVFVHALRNALIPVLTILGMLVAEILGGSILVENIFSLPGVGKLLSDSVQSRDFPLIQTLVLYLSVIVVICNFIIDMIYSIIDPRIRR